MADDETDIQLCDAGPRDLMRSLRSTACPACGLGKRRMQTVCGHCWRLLPGPFREPLHRSFGHGYEAAFRAALLALGCYRVRGVPAAAEGGDRDAA